MGVVSMTSICGIQSLKFENAPYLKGWASVAGKKEGEGPLGNQIDQIIEDPYFGQESWELAEGRFMKQAAMLAISKADLHKNTLTPTRISATRLRVIYWNRIQQRFLE